MQPLNNPPIRQADLDLYEFTGQVLELPTDSCVTLGDMHGNALKLFYLLCFHDCFESEMYHQNHLENLYYEFHELYEKDADDFDTQFVADAVALVDKLVFRSDCSVRFIGDLLADRGKNDFLTLLLIKRMHVCALPYTIILSNHDAEFFYALETNTDDAPRVTRMSDRKQFRSANNLAKLLKKGLIDIDELKTWMQTCIYPYVKVIDIEEYNNVTVVYTHAPVSRSQIVQLHDYLVKQGDVALAAIEKLFSEMVEDINAAVANNLRNGKFARMLEDIKSSNMLRNFIWMRFPSVEKSLQKHLTTDIYDNPDDLVYVCGHDRKPDDLKTNQCWYSLDQGFGKSQDSGAGAHFFWESQGMLFTQRKTHALMQDYKAMLFEYKDEDLASLLWSINRAIGCYALDARDGLARCLYEINESIFALPIETLWPVKARIDAILEILNPPDLESGADMALSSGAKDEEAFRSSATPSKDGFFGIRAISDDEQLPLEDDPESDYKEPPSKRLKSSQDPR